jgi:single-strand DNA-binding protein
MTANFADIGNLGADPELKDVEVEGEPRRVTELRIRFDRPVPTDDGFEDRGGFWLDVSLWDKRGGERAAAVLRKGARVFVRGTLVQEQWKDRETGGDRSKFKLQAEYVALDLARVESVELRQSQSQSRATGTNG